MSRALRAVLGVVLIVVGALYYQPLVAVGIGLVVGAALEKTPARLRRLLEQSVMVRSAVAPQEIVYGETRKSGVVTWYDANGDNNKYLWFVVTVCEHEINKYTTLWIDGESINLATEVDSDVTGGGTTLVTKSAFVDSDSTQLVKCGFYMGTDSQTADTDLVNSAPTYWTDDHDGQGVAYFWVRLEVDASVGGTDPDNPGNNVWAKGWPRDLSVTLQGAKVYNPRLDTTQIIDSTTSPITYGSGSHRVDTASTWAWSDNSVLCRADYIRHDRLGPGFVSSDIDWEVVATQADIADVLVDIPDSETQKRYTLNGIVNTADAGKEIVEQMQTADHGTTLFLPGGIEILVGQWAASSHTIDSTWLAGAMNTSSALPTDNAYNAVRGQYLAAHKDYTLIGFEPRTSSAYETEDGVGRVWTDVSLGFTSNEFAAQRIAITELKKSRQQTTMTIDCNFRGELVQLWQVVTIDLPGYSSDSSPSEVKTFRVTSKTTKTDGITTLTLREESESDWTYEVGDLATPPTVLDVLRGQAGPLPPENLAATTVVNGVLLDWDNQSMAGVSHIEVYASATNNRSGISFPPLTRTASESYLHELAEGVTRFYWILARAENGLVSTWEPLADTPGVEGTAGEAGADGSDAERYYVHPTNGTALRNSSSPVSINGTTISAQNTGNLLIDSGNGFLTAGFADDDVIDVTGFSDTDNNISSATVSSAVAGFLQIASPEGDDINNEAAGNNVTIAVVGELTIQARKTTGSSDAHLAAGSIKLYVDGVEVTSGNGYGTGSDGYTGV
ncbi:MAG: hypothetical protein DRQ89_15045, partial [Epsilonproteobacteria bacterium]